MKYKNECQCGRPTNGKSTCGQCWPVRIYCVTAKRKRELARLIVERRGAGLRRNGKALNIGGYYVQGMV